MDEKHISTKPSVNQSIWTIPDTDFDQIARITQKYDLPEPIARIIAARDIDFDEIASFLNPTLRDDFPDPLSMADMSDMAQFVAEAVIGKKSLGIFADFDVDGATSAALLYRFLSAVGVKDVPVYIPDRLTEGYGPNKQAFQQLKDQGVDVLFVLDCGTTSFEVMKAGKDIGLDIIILDHHEPEATLPDVAHVVNPKRQDDESGLEILAAIGVTFMACVAVNTALRERDFYAQNSVSEPKMKGFLDLVALGTVCDMVPLTGVNRLFVKHGFLMMAQTDNQGLRSLIKVSGLEPPITPYHAGFVLGPRINAGSRVHRSDLGAKLLSTDDPTEADKLSWALNDANDKRKALQADMEQEAIKQIETYDLEQHPIIIVDGDEWHTGLSGLVAGRLKEKYKKPVCVVAYVKTGEGGVEGRGSGRSVPGIHMAEAFMMAKEQKLLVKGGGHAMAGGFTIMPDKLGAFKDFMYAYVSKRIQDENNHVTTLIDGILSIQGVRPTFVTQLNNLMGPFGQGNPEPVFCFENVRLIYTDIVGESHIRTTLSDWEGGLRIKAIAFRAVGTPLGDALLAAEKQALNILGSLKLNHWNGETRAEIHIQDASFVMAQDRKEQYA